VESLKVYTELMSVLGDLLSLMADIEIKYGKGINDVVKEAISPHVRFSEGNILR
jgi:hypothetical protein